MACGTQDLTHVYQFIRKESNEHGDEDIHKARSARVLSTRGKDSRMPLMRMTGLERASETIQSHYLPSIWAN